MSVCLHCDHDETDHDSAGACVATVWHEGYPYRCSCPWEDVQ